MHECPYCSDELESIEFKNGVQYRCNNTQCPVHTEDCYPSEKLEKLANAMRSERDKKMIKMVIAYDSIKEAIMEGLAPRMAVKIWLRASNLAKRGMLEEIKMKNPEKLVRPSNRIPGAWSRVRYWGPRGFSEQYPEGISMSKARDLFKRGELIETHELESKPSVKHRHWEVKHMNPERRRGLGVLFGDQEQADRLAEIREKARKAAREDMEETKKGARRAARKDVEELEKKARKAAREE